MHNLEGFYHFKPLKQGICYLVKNKYGVRILCVCVGFPFKVVKRAPKFEKSFHKYRIKVCWHAKF